MVSKVEPQRAQRIKIFVCRETTTNKNIPQIRAKSFCPIVVSRLGKKDLLSVLCGREKKSLFAEMSSCKYLFSLRPILRF